MYLAVESEATVVYSEPLFVYDHNFYHECFHSRSTHEGEYCSECIRTVAASYG